MDALRVHQMEAGDGERGDRETASFTAKADHRARAALGRRDAAATWNVALAANKVLHAIVIRVENL